MPPCSWSWACLRRLDRIRGVTALSVLVQGEFDERVAAPQHPVRGTSATVVSNDLESSLGRQYFLDATHPAGARQANFSTLDNAVALPLVGRADCGKATYP